MGPKTGGWYLTYAGVLIAYLAGLLNWIVGDLRFAACNHNYMILAGIHLLPVLAIIVAATSPSLTLRPAGAVLGAALALFSLPQALYCTVKAFESRCRLGEIDRFPIRPGEVTIVATVEDVGIVMTQHKQVIPGVVRAKHLSTWRGNGFLRLMPVDSCSFYVETKTGAERVVRLKIPDCDDDA